MQNLWSDLDRSQPDDTSQGESQKREENDPASAPRRFQERDFLKRLRAWLLSQYVLAYGRSLGSSRIYQRCYWLDALSFERRQLSTPKNQPQSPPPALQLPLQIGEALQQKPYPLTLYAWLFARDSRTPPRKSPALELVLPQESTILPTSWLEAAPTLLPQIDQSSAIFLLNPFGPELFRHEDLAPFYQRTPPTELFLLIWHKQLFQHLETARREMEAGRPIGQIALTQFLRGDRWKTLLSEQSEEVRRDRLVDLLIGSMERHFLTVQRLDLPIHVGPATIEKAPCTLLFATRRPDSLAILNDSYCHYQRDLILHSGQGTLGEAWFADRYRQQHDQEMTQLCHRVQDQGRKQKVRRWPDLRQHFILNNFGRYTIYEYNQVIAELIKNKDVQVRWRRGEHGPSDIPIPTGEDTLVWR